MMVWLLSLLSPVVKLTQTCSPLSNGVAKITTEEENVDNISLYSVCRSWFRNGEIEAEDKSKSKEEEEGIKLPPPLPAREQTFEPELKEAEQEKEGDETDKDYMKQHMKRWKAARKLKSKQYLANSERFEERLKILFS